MGVANDFFVFDGVSSKDYDALISGYETFGLPERDEKTVDVAGRNGSLVFDNGRWKNKAIAYKGLIYHDFRKHYEELESALASKTGYCRLEDTINPEIYRIARRSGEINFNLHGDYKAASFSVGFDCKPQKYLKSGEKAIEFTGEGVLMNTTQYTALPLIRVYSAGTLQIGNYTMIISEVDGYIDIDCDLMNAYKGSANLNNKVSGEFPKLDAGQNGVRLNTISKIEIIPRWWTL